MLDGVLMGAGDFGFLARAMGACAAVGAGALGAAARYRADGAMSLRDVWGAWGALMAARCATLLWRLEVSAASPFERREKAE